MGTPLFQLRDIALYECSYSFLLRMQVDDELMCVGMTDGVISIHKRKPPKDEEELALKKLERKKYSRYIAKEKYYTPDEVNSFSTFPFSCLVFPSKKN